MIRRIVPCTTSLELSRACRAACGKRLFCSAVLVESHIARLISSSSSFNSTHVLSRRLNSKLADYTGLSDQVGPGPQMRA